MELQETDFPIRGHALIIVRRNGVEILRRECENTITELGDALVASRMSNASTAAVSHMAIGSGSGGGVSSTALGTELARVALTSTTQGTAGNDNVVTYVAFFDVGVGTGTIGEVGLLNASSAGVLFNYLSPTPIVKTAIDDITFTLTIRYGAST